MGHRGINHRLAGIIGNLLEHYDTALFGLLAPFLAPLFFQGKDPLVSLILTYSILPMGMITRPLGSLVFGWIGDHLGRREALSLSLSGVALTTFLMGSIPVYAQIGIWAPLSLTFVRMLQGFFAAGETIGGAVFVLEHTRQKKHALMGSLYDVSSIAGILLASFLVMIMSQYQLVPDHWRWLFWSGSLTAIFGVILRIMNSPVIEYTPTKHSGDSWVAILKKNRRALLSIIVVSGFSYTTYVFAFTLMNGLVPLITSITKAEMVKVNTALIIIDGALLPLFGYIAQKQGKERIMMWGAFAAAFMAIPLLALLAGATLYTVIAVRFCFVIAGVAVAAPYHAWAMELVMPQHRYLVLAFGYALGSQLLGGTSCVIALTSYKLTHWSGASGCYLFVLGICTGYAVYNCKKVLHDARESRSVAST